MCRLQEPNEANKMKTKRANKIDNLTPRVALQNSQLTAATGGKILMRFSY